MDGFHLFYDASTGLFRYTDDADEDSGVEDLPFSLYSSDTYGSIDTKAETSLCSNRNDADDDDLTYIDDVRDGDYRPNKSAYVSKKGKRQYRRRQINGRTCLSQLITPEKQQHGLYSTLSVGEEECQIRHYARKDRTPNTILKMMERHRESERVRHHTLNESMKDVCLRIPGYDPDVKETKVIQMQRIIAYECFLENTLTSVCEKLGINPRSLKMSSNLITDAMKTTPIEEFYQPSSYRTSDAEDEDQHVPSIAKIKPETSAHGSKVFRCISNEKNSHQYRQEKISSPTIDSTTSDLIKVLPISPVPQMPGYQLFGNGCFPAQCFIPINNSANNLESSQESGIKVEGTQSTVHEEDSQFHETLGPLIDQSVLLEPVTPSFMKEDLNTSATTNPDNEQVFDLSSPVRQHEKVFLQSPKPIGFWSKQGRSCFLGKADTPNGKEMQTVSPENVLETKMKNCNDVTQSTSGSKFQMMTAIPVSDIFQLTTDQIIHAAQNSSEIQYVCDPQGRQFSTYKILSGISKENGCIKVQHIYIPKFENGVMKIDSLENSCKNKRKRYTPLKSMEELEDECVESDEEDFDGMSSLCGETTDTDIEEHGSDSEMEQSQPVPQLPVPQMGQYPYGFPQNWGYPAPAPCRGQGKKVKYAKPLVDHRKSTWMNGFMMFSKLNRPKYTSENPGVHTSQIQRMMGEAWRKLTAEEKQPYKDQAKEWCERMKEAGVHENQAQTGGKVKKRQSKKTNSEKDSGNSSLAKALDQIKSIAEATKEKQSDTESKSSKSDTVNGTEFPEKDL